MTKTFLIIDGQANYFRVDGINESFATAGIDAEFEAVFTLDQAKQVILDWKARGLKLGVLTCDADVVFDCAGVQEMEEILDWIKSDVGEDMMPEKIFMHSATPPPSVETKYGSIQTLRDQDLMHLQNEQSIYYDHLHLTRRLANWMNANWGTKLVCSEEEEKNLQDPNGPLDYGDVYNLLIDRHITPLDGIRRLQMDKLEILGSAWVELPDDHKQRPKELEFSAASEGAAGGIVAFNANDIARIKSQNAGEQIILVLKSAAGFQVPPSGIDGLVVLENDKHAMHIKQVCDNIGIPALIGLRTEHCRGKENTAEISSDGFSFYDRYGKPGPLLTVGSGISIQAFSTSGTLYPGRFPAMHYAHNNFGEDSGIPAVTDQILQDAGIQIKANADTAEQVEHSIKYGAHGIGLVRTEHMFFEADKKAMLREYLLTRAPSQGLITSFREAQEADLLAILNAASESTRASFPVTVRLLDAPPDEFMTTPEVGIFKTRIGAGNTRGAQAALRTQGLYEAQITALCDAFTAAHFKHSLSVLVPNVTSEDEMDQVRVIFNQYTAGTGITLIPMIENRAYLSALMGMEKIPYASVSFGTNDLTTDFMGGIARNDAPAIMEWMKMNRLHGLNPFLSLTDPVCDALGSFVHRPGAPKATICGGQVADDERSIVWAARNRISLSVPYRCLTYTKLLSAKQHLPEPALK